MVYTATFTDILFYMNYDIQGHIMCRYMHKIVFYYYFIYLFQFQNTVQNIHLHIHFTQNSHTLLQFLEL